MRLVQRFCLLICIGLLGACSSGGGEERPASQSPSAFVYTSNSFTFVDGTTIGGSISGYRVTGDNGVLVPVSLTPFHVDGSGGPIAANPKSNMLYMLNSGRVDVFRRGADGVLQEVSRHPLAQVISGGRLCVHPSGRWLYAVVVKSLPLSIIRQSSILVLPVIESGPDAGKLGSVLQEFPPPADLNDPRHYGDCAISGSELYVGLSIPTADFDAGGISSMTIAGDGTLAFAPGSPLGVRDRLGSVVRHPFRPFVYAGGRRFDVAVKDIIREGIDIFGVNADGSLILLSRVGTPFGFTEMAIDPKGQFLYATKEESNAIFGYRIVDNGDLIPITPASYPAPGPGTITFDPSGNSLYVAISPHPQSDNGLQSFSVNRNTGELVAKSSPPIIGSPIQVISVLP